MKQSLCVFSFVCLAVALVGCGPSQINVKGKVLYGSKTLKYGEVVFFGSDGAPRSSKISPDGTYEIKDVAGGDMKIAVVCPDPKDIPNPDRDKKGPDPENMKNWIPIHPSYADQATSGLTVKLTARDNEHDIKMTEKPLAPGRPPR